MNRLWIRFSLTFGLIALFAPILLGSIGVLMAQSGVLRLFVRNELVAPGSLTDQLVEHYRSHSSWDDVAELVASYERALPADLTLIFVDEALQPLFGSLETGAELTDGAAQLMSIMVDGRVRGYLSLVQRSAGGVSSSRLDRPLLLNQVSNVLLAFSAVSAVLGLTAGLVAARTMITPLAQLAETARRLGKRDFMARAAVRGSTELREVAYAFNEMAHDLEQAETLRRNLVADVAHELRTPLSVLRANLQALVDGIYPLERSEIDKLLDQTELLNRLVDELRELSLAEARQLPLQQTAFDLNELMSLIVETFQPTVQKRGLSLDLRLPSEIIRFTGDRGRIQQVLNNLIQNAITHTPPGGKVHLTLSQDQGHIHLMVQDTGEGIPARHLPHVFDRFYRVDYSRSRETGGTGLGLAIAKAIIELHDGEIQVMSDGLLGSGSTFTISLPRSER